MHAHSENSKKEKTRKLKMVKRGRPAGSKDKRPRKKQQLPTTRAIVVKPQKKVFDIPWSSQTIPISGNNSYLEQSLNLVAIGGGKFNRIGNKITVCNINVRGFVSETHDNTGAVPNFARIVLYQDKQSNQAAYLADAMADLLYENANGASTSGSIVQKFRNYERLDRFKILHDETLKLEPQQLIDVQNGNLNARTWFNISKKVEIPIFYETKTPPSVTVGMDEITSSNIGMIISTTASIGTVTTCRFVTRIKYYDN